MVKVAASKTLSRVTHVYFDGSCPICRREIAFYQKQIDAELISWIDVSSPAYAPTVNEPSCQLAMARFHVLLGDQRLLHGSAAFAALWASLPRFKLLGRLFMYQPLASLLSLAYRLFLIIRPRMQSLFS